MQPFEINVITSGLAGAICLMGAAIIFFRRKLHPGVANFAGIFLLAMLLWSAGMALHGAGVKPFANDEPLPDAAAVGLVILGGIFLFLTCLIMGYRSGGRNWIVVGVLWCAIAALIGLDGGVLQRILSIEVSQGWLQSGLRVWLILGWGIFVSGSAYYSIRTYQQASHYSLEAPYWMGALLLTGLGDAAWWAGFGAIGDVFHILGAVGVTFVVSSARLPALGEASRRSVSGLIYTVLVVICYTVGLTLALTIAQSLPAINPFIIAIIFGALLALLLNPGLKRIQERLQERVSGTKDEMTDLLRQYSLSITNTLDLNLLATVVVGTASEFLEFQRGSLYLVDLEKSNGDAGWYTLRGIKGMGNINPQPGRLQRESPLAEVFGSGNLPVTQNQISLQPRFQEISSEERSWLDSMGAGVYVPIYSKDKWIGLLALGPKSSGKEYTDQDLAFLSTVAGPTAVALENARLVEGLMRVNEEMRNAYQALDQANRHLERLDKAKSDFITIVSHEMRTPMNLISGSSHMLLDESELSGNPYYKSLLANLHNGTLRLEKIIESMLDIARIDSRLMVVELQSVTIQSVIRMVHDDLAKDAQGRKQTFEIRDLEKLHPVMADLPALRKVFYNLVVNAIKYTPDNGKITIWGRDIPANGKDLPDGGVEVVVADTGIGIDPNYRDLVFAKFYQTGESALHSSG
jgi:signal transduction histidine kinase